MFRGQPFNMYIEIEVFLRGHCYLPVTVLVFIHEIKKIIQKYKINDNNRLLFNQVKYLKNNEKNINKNIKEILVHL